MMSLGVTDRFPLMVAVLPEVLLTIALSPVGTVPPDQFAPSFQSVLVVPVQSADWATEMPREATNAATKRLLNLLTFIFIIKAYFLQTRFAIAQKGNKQYRNEIFLNY